MKTMQNKHQCNQHASFLLTPKDSYYVTMLQIPPGGLELRTRIYVQVKASNLTERYISLTFVN